MVVDYLGRELVEGDYVTFYSQVYQIKKVYEKTNTASIMLVQKTESTKSVTKLCKYMFRLPAEDILMWTLKK